jgi:hypothetical protein|tara:strand:+ start:627 stop:1022 length:396 start_codon:yes stop_codon:yes gene_type:complete
MREITKRLQQMSNQLGYEQREKERIAIVKQHLMDCLENINLTLQDIEEDCTLIWEEHIFNEWMVYSYDIYLFFDIDTLDIVNEFLKEYGPSEAHNIQDYVLVQDYAERMVFKHIDHWAESEVEKDKIQRRK